MRVYFQQRGLEIRPGRLGWSGTEYSISVYSVFTTYGSTFITFVIFKSCGAVGGLGPACCMIERIQGEMFSFNIPSDTVFYNSNISFNEENEHLLPY